MPTADPLETDAAAFASDFDRDFEAVSAHYGPDTLDRYRITVEYTVGGVLQCICIGSLTPIETGEINVP